jgi:hypothetical protein
MASDRLWRLLAHDHYCPTADCHLPGWISTHDQSVSRLKRLCMAAAERQRVDSVFIRTFVYMNPHGEKSTALGRRWEAGSRGGCLLKKHLLLRCNPGSNLITLLPNLRIPLIGLLSSPWKVFGVSSWSFEIQGRNQARIGRLVFVSHLLIHHGAMATVSSGFRMSQIAVLPQSGLAFTDGLAAATHAPTREQDSMS